MDRQAPTSPSPSELESLGCELLLLFGAATVVAMGLAAAAGVPLGALATTIVAAVLLVSPIGVIDWMSDLAVESRARAEARQAPLWDAGAVVVRWLLPAAYPLLLAAFVASLASETNGLAMILAALFVVVTAGLLTWAVRAGHESLRSLLLRAAFVLLVGLGGLAIYQLLPSGFFALVP